MKTYTESDIVTVSRGSEEDGTYEEMRVPKTWVGTHLLEDGFTKKGGSGGGSSSSSPEPVDIPEGDPQESWSNKQLDAYAERENIDLTDVKNVKADKLAAIQKAKLV